MIVVGLSNNENASTPRIVNALAAITLGVPVTKPYQPKEVAVSAPLLEPLQATTSVKAFPE